MNRLDKVLVWRKSRKNRAAEALQQGRETLAKAQAQADELDQLSRDYCAEHTNSAAGTAAEIAAFRRFYGQLFRVGVSAQATVNQLVDALATQQRNFVQRHRDVAAMEHLLAARAKAHERALQHRLRRAQIVKGRSKLV